MVVRVRVKPFRLVMRDDVLMVGICFACGEWFYVCVSRHDNACIFKCPHELRVFTRSHYPSSQDPASATSPAAREMSYTVWAIGGWNGSQLLSSVEYFDTRTSQWARFAKGRVDDRAQSQKPF